MSNSVSSDADQLPSRLGQLSEDIVPVSSRELFWRAKYLAPSPALGHLPFLFWLIGAVQPMRTVTLNLGEGTAHFAACQAIEKLGFDAGCHGFGSWDGAGVPDDVAAYNDAQYGEFSFLAEMSAAQAARRMLPGSVDLLIADGPQDGATIEAILTRWPERMSERSALLLTGLDALDDRDTETLGAWVQDKSSLRFEHEGGMLLVWLGDSGPRQGIRLGQLDPNSAAFMSVARIFARLGASHVNEWQAQEAAQHVGRLSAALLLREEEAAALGADRDAQAKKLAKLESGSGADLRARRAKAVLNAARQEARSAAAKLERITAERDDARAESEDEQQLLRKRLTASGAECAALREDQSDRAQLHEAELAELTDMLERETAQRIALSQELAIAKKVQPAPEAAPGPSVADAAQHLADLATLTDALSDAEERLIVQAGERSKERAAEAKVAVANADSAAAEITSLRGDIESERASGRAQAHEAMARAEQVARELDTERAGLREMGIDMQRQIDVGKAYIAQQADNLARAANKIEALEQHSANLEQGQADLMSSASWRVTRPLRGVGTAFRKLK
jgi:hypothetical protein